MSSIIERHTIFFQISALFWGIIYKTEFRETPIVLGSKGCSILIRHYGLGKLIRWLEGDRRAWPDYWLEPILYKVGGDCRRYLSIHIPNHRSSWQFIQCEKYYLCYARREQGY